MRRCLLLALLATSLAGAASGQNVVRLPVDGQVADPGDLIRVNLAGTSDAALGDTLRTYDLVPVGGREVGRLTGVYRVVRSEWPDAWAERIEGQGLRGGQIRQAVELDARERAAVYTIETTPDSARVLWEGRYIGLSPLTVDLVPGRHTFRLEKAGLEPETVTVEAVGGLIQAVTVTLQEALPAEFWYTRAERAFVDGRFAEADSFATRAIENADGSLSPTQVAEGPQLLEAARLSADVAGRMGRAGVAADQIRQAGSMLRLVLDTAPVNVPAARIHLETLRSLTGDDPVVERLAETLERRGGGQK